MARKNIAKDQEFLGDVSVKGNLIVEGSFSDTIDLPAFENLTAGDYVNTFNDAGTLKARLATATTATKPASGYVNDTVTAGNTVTVFRDGINPNVSGLTVGDLQFLSDTTPGGVTAIKPSAGSSFIQQLGEALSATTMEVEIQDVQGAASAKKSIEASEDLTAGDGVNVFDDGGTTKVQKWDATAVGKEADGFVKDAVTAGQNATVFFTGAINDQASGLTGGERLFMDTTAGGVTTTAPPASGNIQQKVGKALSATEYIFAPESPVEVA